MLLILSDDLNTSLGCYGHPRCRTPHLDRLAARGVRFERMYCQFPICGASRSSLMTGLYPYSTGDLSNTTTFRQRHPQLVTLSQLFMQNDYHAARVSKIYHMGIPRDILAGTAGADDPASWQAAYNIQGDEQNTAGRSVDHSPGWNSSQTFLRVEAAEDDLAMADGKAATKAIELLKQHRDRPFFLAVGFVRPHVPLVAPKAYFDSYPDDAMVPADVLADDLDDVGRPTRNYKTTGKLKIRSQDIPAIHAAYYSAVSHMDAQVGRLLDALAQLDLQDNTIVVFSSDHGYHLGEHHKWQKQHLFEQTTRVPFILSVPWLPKTHGRAAERICELVDLYPTLADLCRLPPPGHLQGQSLRPLLEDVDTPQWTKRTALTVSTRGGVSLRTPDWRYTQWNDGEDEELYDLRNDPDEFHNVADQPKYQAVRKRLAEQLQAKKQAAGA
ncbi:sulfatase [Roseimaritima sediminicola]|uniref:sulfatase n=1 Tax=Roseimaritima sediminicola TaxID=2662066 RepID=UPI00138731C3|nr:sulfatase [Roseimaritima sediminicola]